MNLLSVILAWARQPAHRYLAHDPLASITRIPRADVERPFLEPDQIARLLRAATTQEETMLIMLGVYAGLRRGELCAIRWDDIDGGDGITGRLWIRRAISAGKITKPKTKSSIWMIDLPSTVLTKLAAYRGNAAETRTCSPPAKGRRSIQTT